jgi:hypothetical protein
LHYRIWKCKKETNLRMNWQWQVSDSGVLFEWQDLAEVSVGCFFWYSWTEFCFWSETNRFSFEKWFRFLKLDKI